MLHYGAANAPNNRKLKNGDLCVLDMGTEYNCYGELDFFVLFNLLIF